MRITFIVIMLSYSAFLFSQVTEAEKALREAQLDSIKGWKYGGVFNLGFSQTAFTNWAAGGLNTISGNTMFSTFANYHSPNMSWDNQLDFSYGLLKQGDSKKAIKTDDKIDFTSKFGYRAGKDLFYAVLGNFKTQTMPGYQTPDDSVKISDFLSPAYILVAVGMDYKPNDKLTIFLAPVTQKTTIVRSAFLADQGAYGVDPATFENNVYVPGKRIRTEFGGYLRIFYKDQIQKSINYQTKLDLFSNYLHNPGNIDVNWEVLINFKITKYFSTAISTQLIYDDDIIVNIDKNKDGIIEESGPRIQFKEIVTIGFSYKF